MDDDKSLEQLASSIQTREQFIEFVRILLEDLENHPERWENPMLERYLEGIRAKSKTSHPYIRGAASEKSSWRLFAEILLSARISE